MVGQDYYKLLGLSKNAVKDDIKKAYRSLAKKYHPDVNKGNKASEEKFKQITEAYSVLSDDKKKADYDNLGSESFSQKYRTDDLYRDANVQDIFRDMGIHFDSFSGNSDIFDQIFGFGSSASSGKADMYADINISLEEAARGVKKEISYHRKIMGKDKLENVALTIPSGIYDGNTLVLRGMADSDEKGKTGDLYVTISIYQHALFQRQDNDLYTKKAIKFSQAVLGGKTEIKTLEGKLLEMKIPPGTKENKLFRLRSYGMPIMNSNEKGDLYVRVFIDIPQLNPSEKKTLEELARKMGYKI